MALNFGISPPGWLTESVNWLGSDQRQQAEHEDIRRAAEFPLQIQKLQFGLATEGLRQQSEAIGLQESRLKLTEQSRELAEWEKDSKNVIPWLTATPEQRRTLPPPAPTSNKGIALVTQVQKADDVNAIKQQLADNQRDKMALQAEMDRQKIQAAADRLAEQNRFNVEIAKIRAGATTEAATIRAGAQVDVQKLRNLSRTDEQGRKLSLDAYLNRHANTVFKDLRSMDDKSTTEELQKKTVQVLIDTYNSMPGAAGFGGTNAPAGKVLKYNPTTGKIE